MQRNNSATKPAWIDADDAPELTDACVDQADFKIAREIIRRCRTPSETRAHIFLRIDKKVLACFREGGPGWQSRMSETLRKAAEIT